MFVLHSPKMQIFVQNLNNETSTLDLESSASVLSVKQLLEARENIPAEDQLLTFAGKKWRLFSAITCVGVGCSECCVQLACSED